MSEKYNKLLEDLKEVVSSRFKGVKTMAEFNAVRQELCDEWSIHDEPVKVKAAGGTVIIPMYVKLVSVLIDGSGISVELLGVRYRDPIEEDEADSTKPIKTSKSN